MSNKDLFAFEKTHHGLLFVLSAPAGTGKNTVVNHLIEAMPGQVVESVSCTTRDKRDYEIEGEHYHFLGRDEFVDQVETDAFLEYAEVFGNMYGTLKKDTEKLTSQGKHVIMIIDTQGAMKIKGKIDAVFIFMVPPSLKELEKRLKQRSTETQDVIEKRMTWAETELTHADSYDYFLINKDIKHTVEVLKSIIVAESHRNRSDS